MFCSPVDNATSRFTGGQSPGKPGGDVVWSALLPIILHCRQLQPTRPTPCPRKKQATLIFDITSSSVEIFLQFLKHLVQE